MKAKIIAEKREFCFVVAIGKKEYIPLRKDSAIGSRFAYIIYRQFPFSENGKYLVKPRDFVKPIISTFLEKMDKKRYKEAKVLLDVLEKIPGFDFEPL